MLINVFGRWINPANILYLEDQRIALRTNIKFLNDMTIDVPGAPNEVAAEINKQTTDRKNYVQKRDDRNLQANTNHNE